MILIKSIFTGSYWGDSGKVDEEQIREMLGISWLFFFSKLLDFIDTVFFVLRKKGQQLSRLHLIHHSLMPICRFFFHNFRNFNINWNSILIFFFVIHFHLDFLRLKHVHY